MNKPSFLDVLHARKVIAQYLPRTPLYHYPLLDELLGAHVYVKHENYQPIGAFKVRGGVNLLSRLSPEEKLRGVITASTGNHGQSIAYAAKLFGVRAVIAVPTNANPIKVAAMKGFGAEIVIGGIDFDDCRAYCERQALENGMRYVSSGDEPLLLAGVATHTLEIFEELPEVDMIFVPVGGGSGAAGACLAAKAINPQTQIIAVQSSAAPSAYLTWRNRKAVFDKMQTIAEGLATRAPFMLPQEILWDSLDDFLLVDDSDLKKCVRLFLEKAKSLSEPAGAASLAGALKIRERVQGMTIALILTGGNISPEQLRECLDA